MVDVRKVKKMSKEQIEEKIECIKDMLHEFNLYHDYLKDRESYDVAISSFNAELDFYCRFLKEKYYGCA